MTGPLLLSTPPCKEQVSQLFDGIYQFLLLALISSIYFSACFVLTAILEAGRRSLDSDSQPMDITYDGDSCEPSGIQPHTFK